MTDRVDLVKALGPHLLVHSAEGPVRSTPTAEALAGRVVLVYFSAHWCPPCRQFTPRLAETYRRLRDGGRAVECVFVSSDQSEAQFQVRRRVGTALRGWRRGGQGADARAWPRP